MPSIVRAMGQGDLEQVHHLFKAAPESEGKFESFLNLVYDRDGEILGYLGVQIVDGYVYAGPLLLRAGASPFIAMRIGAALEASMAAFGISSFFFVIPEEMDEWQQMVKRAGNYEDLGASGKFHWYGRTKKR